MTPVNDPNSPWLDGWKVAEVAYGMVIALLAWMGNRMSTKLDTLEKTAVTREELEKHFGQMRDDRKYMHLENKEALQRIEDKIDDAQHKGSIATRIQRTEKDIEDLRTWKHKVDPYINRRVEP